jgi:hypothetical protein
MNKFSIKMQGNYYIALIEFLKEFNEDNAFSSQLSKLVYRELKEAIIRASLRASVAMFNKTRMISFQIQKSQALLFFCTFNGNNDNTFASVAVNEMCRQIEEVLFIKENLTFEQL